jgi:hypothetical protein
MSSRTLHIVGCATLIAVAALIAPDVLALTGGPTPPEVRGFEPVGVSELVDPFTGDFSYRVDLGDVGGYPLVLSYDGNVTMDQEASWVGLGWSLNPGAIVRSKRGLPDEFNGEPVLVEQDMAPNWTAGLTLAPRYEFFAAKVDANGNKVKNANGNDVKDLGKVSGSVSLSVGARWNSYTGWGASIGVNPGFESIQKNKHHFTTNLGFSADSLKGVGITPSIGFEHDLVYKKRNATEIGNISIGVPINSVQGLSGLNLNASRTNGNLKSTGLGVQWSGADGASAGSSNPTYSSFVSFLGPDRLPRTTMPTTSAAGAISASFGLEALGGHWALSTSGYVSSDWLAVKEKTYQAFGYQHLDGATMGSTSVMLDFQRENDAAFSEDTPNLPLTYLTYDLFSVTAQGLQGQFRSHRSDVGVVYDATVTSNGTTGDASVEFGGGATARGGADFGLGWSTAESGPWTAMNLLHDVLGWLDAAPPTVGADAVTVAREHHWYQMVGELTPDAGGPAALAGPDLVAPVLSDARSNPVLHKKWDSDGEDLASADSLRTERRARGTLVSALSATEAAQAGLQKKIPWYDANQFDLTTSGYTPAGSIERYDTTTSRKFAQQPSEFRVTKPGGAVYVYGFPVMSYQEVEASFSSMHVEDSADTCDAGLVPYQDGEDEVGGNEHGRDHFVHRMTMPPYATSWLLTAVLSPDYVDRTGDGPTLDDKGTFTRFNYTLVHGEAKDDAYRWRVPVTPDGFAGCAANYNQGLLSDVADDKGSYLYGEREHAVLHSIETKTAVAEFHTSDRRDSLGVEDTCGRADATQTVPRLDRIEFYARRDRLLRGANAIPTKTAWFEYDYSLVSDKDRPIPNVDPPSNVDEKTEGQGKLTLKKVWFTHANDPQGKRNPYTFGYADPNHDGKIDATHNPPYDLKAYDAWGAYKENRGCGDDEPAPWEDPSTDEFVSADDANARASAWLLTDVGLPSGGRISVDYEADDFRYVADKPAAYMARIVGTSAVLDQDPMFLSQTSRLDDNSGPPIPFLFFELQAQPPPTVADVGAWVRERYLPDSEYVPFRFRMQLDDDEQFDNVPGWAKVQRDDDGDDCMSAYKMTDGTWYGWLRLEPANVADNELEDGELQPDDCEDHRGGYAASDSTRQVSPMTRSAWQFVRLYRSEIAFGSADYTSGNADFVKGSPDTEFLNAFAKAVGQITSFFTGYNRRMLQKDFGTHFDNTRSWIQLRDPDGRRRGGGARVRQVYVDDAWGTMTGGTGASRRYTTTYDYTEVVDGETVSTGVASSLPLTGRDENPARQPEFVDDRDPKGLIHWLSSGQQKLWAPDDRFYQESPYGEYALPAPVVGYSKVTVRQVDLPIGKSAPNALVDHATGKVVHEFYTERDAPTRTTTTGPTIRSVKPNAVFQILKTVLVYRYNGVQGWLVDRPNMHGKPKATRMYGASDEDHPISWQEYHYRDGKTEDFPLIAPDGTVTDAALGFDVDLAVDVRQDSSEVTHTGGQGNLDVLLAAILPIPIPIILPSYTTEDIRVRIATATKVVDRFPVLDATTVYDGGSAVTTATLAWDARTGEARVSATPDEYDNTVYGATWPAHWAYPGMAPAYLNDGLRLSQVTFDTNGDATGFAPLVLDLFQPGDELLLQFGGVPGYGWVTEVDAANDRLHVVDAGGSPISGTGSLRIVRSGHRNMHTLPIASTATLESPIGSGTYLVSKDTKVVSASAAEYSEDWTFECAGDDSTPCEQALGFDAIVHDGESIQAAIDAAVAGDRICVDPGYYGENLTFTAKKDGIEVVGVVGSGRTILFVHSGTVVTFKEGIGPTTLLQGFTITGGAVPGDGGGVIAGGASPTLRDLVIAGNKATRDGGGAWFSNSEAVLEDVSFHCNTAGSGGGAFVSGGALTLRGVAFVNNDAVTGGGLALVDAGTLDARNLALVSNDATSVGGGVFAAAGVQMSVVNGLILGNNASPTGGGVMAEDSGEGGETELSFRNVTWVGNASDEGGSALHAPEADVEVYSSIAAFNGGAKNSLASWISSFAVVDRLISYDNLVDAPQAILHSYVDPKFVEVDLTQPAWTWDVTLAPGSAAIDQGDPNGWYNDDDATPNDLGAYGGPGVDFGAYVHSAAWYECPEGEPPEALADTAKATCVAPGATINPYRWGVRGDWRPWRAHAFETRRTYASTGAGYVPGSMKTDGTYLGYDPFWMYWDARWRPIYEVTYTTSLWREASTSTLYSDDGVPLEEVDALGRYSAVVLSPDGSTVLAAATNSRQRQLATDDFEWYDLLHRRTAHSCSGLHFFFRAALDHASAEAAHTGWWSLAVQPGETLTTSYPVTTQECTDEAGQLDPPVIDVETAGCACAGGFAPDAGVDYVLGYWVYQPSTPSFEPYETRMEVAVDGQKLAFSEELRTPPVEGWQRVEATFTIDAAVAAGAEIEVSVTNPGGGVGYVDDVRIAPFDAAVSTHVYDNRRGGLVAQLDDNNYASFYQYARDGALTRVLKETERGVETIQESRSHLAVPKLGNTQGGALPD